MRKVRSTILCRLATLAAVMLLALPVRAQITHCSEVCTQTTACDTTCRTQTGPIQQDEEFSTCGEWGICDAPCQPDWEVIDTESKGGFTLNYFFPERCEFYSTYLITERDMNQCGEPDRTWCYWTLTATRDDHFCCHYYFCSPDACHQP